MENSKTPNQPTKGLPAWFQQGHLRDDVGREMDTKEEYATYMSTMKKPQEGMRCETSVRTTDGQWFRLSGMVTWVGEPPSLQDFATNESLFMGLASSEGANTKEMSAKEKRDYIYRFLGCLHGQQMKTVSRLSNMPANRELPIQSHDVIELTYRFNDSMFFPWIVEGFRVLQESEIDNLPPFFYEFYEGCNCPRCMGRAENKLAAKK